MYFRATEVTHMFRTARVDFFGAKWVPTSEKLGKTYNKILHYDWGL